MKKIMKMLNLNNCNYILTSGKWPQDHVNTGSRTAGKQVSMILKFVRGTHKPFINGKF